MLPFIAPLIANGLGLLANGVLQKGTEWVKNQTGIDLEKASLTTEDLTTLKQFEMEHEEELQKLSIEKSRVELEETKVYLGDVDSARGKEIKITEAQGASWLQKNITSLLAVGIVSLTFWLFWWVTLQDVNRLDNKDIIIYILGALSSMVIQVISYYFGSSKGSASKEETIKAIGSRRSDK